MRRPTAFSLLEPCVWIVTAGLLLALGLRVGKEAAPVDPPLTERGSAMLALPAALAKRSVPLEGWDRLSDAEQAPSFEPAETVPGESVPEKVQSAGPFRIQVRGRISRSEGVLYCFFDTERRRWFRLLPGESDPDSSVALESCISGGPVVLRDLLDGHRYSIETGGGEPVPLN